MRDRDWAETMLRALPAAQRRLRDQWLARQFRAPGFRVGRTPRLLGMRCVQLGEDFHAGDALWMEAVTSYAGERFEPVLRIGAHARLSDRVHIGCVREVLVGDHLLCGSGVLITDHAHGSYGAGEGASDPLVPPAMRPLHSGGPVRIGSNVWLGDGVAVLPGAVVGDGCVVGAHAVVTGVLPAGTMAVGSPARVIRRWDAGARAWVAAG